MENLQEAAEKICDLKGSLMAIETLIASILDVLPEQTRAIAGQQFERLTEIARTVLSNTVVSELTIAAFDRDVARMKTKLQ